MATYDVTEARFVIRGEYIKDGQWTGPTESSFGNAYGWPPQEVARACKYAANLLRRADYRNLHVGMKVGGTYIELVDCSFGNEEEWGEILVNAYEAVTIVLPDEHLAPSYDWNRGAGHTHVTEDGQRTGPPII